MHVDMAQGNVPLLEFGSMGDKPTIPTIVDYSSKSHIVSLPESEIKTRKRKKSKKKYRKLSKEELLSHSSIATTTYDATMLPIMNTLINWTPTSTSQVNHSFQQYNQVHTKKNNVWHLQLGWLGWTTHY